MKKLNRLEENSERQFNKLKNKINEQSMGLEIITESEVSQTNKVVSYDATYMCNLKKKMTQVNLFTKQKQTHRFRKQLHGYQRAKRGRGKLGD